MPVTKSAIKKAKQDERNRKRNRVLINAYKEASKNVRKLAESGKINEAKKALSDAYSKIDKAAKRKVLHKNNASRRKARLAALIKKAEGAKKPKKKTTSSKSK